MTRKSATGTALLDQRKREELGPTFGGLEAAESEFSKAAIAILPVPYDLTSTYNKGADRGPAAILQASTQVELYDIETESEVYQHGIATLAPLYVRETPDVLCSEVDAAISWLLEEGKFPVLLGGEHSVSAGFGKALARHYPGLSVLQLDAHGDTREEYHGSPYNHACVMARLREVAPIMQVGIRAIDRCETGKMERSRVLFAHEIHASETKAWQDKVLNKLSDKVFVTIDLDCFDLSVMPSTGTPEPGGLFWHQVLPLLRRVAAERTVVGFDVVELLPRASNPGPDFLAAKLVYQFLSYIFSNKQL